MEPIVSKTGKNGIKMKFKVASGEYANRVLFFNFYIGGPADKVTQITQSTGKAMLVAVKAPAELIAQGDISFIVGKDITIGVKVQPAVGPYAEKNEYSYCKEYIADKEKYTPSSEFGF
jgi:hypothetical protein